MSSRESSSRESGSRESRSRSSIYNTSNSLTKSKAYFSDNTADKIHKYLYYSNYNFDPDVFYPKVYNVNLFCLYKIAEILSEKVDKYKKRNNNKRKSLVGRLSKSFSSRKSGSSSITRTNKNKTNNNNNTIKTNLVNEIVKVIDFIKNELVINPIIEEFNKFATDVTKHIIKYLINDKLFNQEKFGKIEFNLIYNSKNTNIPDNFEIPETIPISKKDIEEIKKIKVEDEAFQWDIINNIEEQIKQQKEKIEQEKEDERTLLKLQSTLILTNAKSINSKKKLELTISQIKNYEENLKKLEAEL